jgi:integrase
MARRVKDAALDTKAARERLAARPKPYRRLVDRGLHICYRRQRGASGAWIARLYQGEGKYIEERLATADDGSDANGVDVLNFHQAVERARTWRDERVRAAAGLGPYTVSDALDDYLAGQTADTKARADSMIRPAMIPLHPRDKGPKSRVGLGTIEVAKLSTDQIRGWRDELAATPPRLRTAKGEPQRHGEADKGKEAVRRRKCSANRLLAILKAALTHAFEEGKVANDRAWRRVTPFEGVGAARVRWLNVDESKRLINAADPAFRPLATAALVTGARYGELCALKVKDFNADAATLRVDGKTGARHLVLTEEAAAFFDSICAARGADEPMLRRKSEEPWGPSNQTKPMAEACQRAAIVPSANFHALRHTFASQAVMNGAPLMVVAMALGHKDTRMVERHYGHLAPGFINDAIRASAPRFGIKIDDKVRRHERRL